LPYAVNLRLFTLFQATTWEGFSHAVWYLYLFQHKGLSLAEMAVLVMLGDGVIVLAEVPTGWLADRLGRRLSMLAGVVMQIASMLLFIVGNAFWVFWLSMAVCGLGDTMRSGADRALLYDSCVAAGQRERYRPLLGHSIMVATFVFVAAQLAGGVIATRLSWTLPFILDAMLSIVGLYAAWRMVEPPRGDDDLPIPVGTAVRPSGVGTGVSLSADPIGHNAVSLTADPTADTLMGVPTGNRGTTKNRGWLALLPLFAIAALLLVPQELSHFHLPAELEVSLKLTPELLAIMYAAFELLAGFGSKLGGSARVGTRTVALALAGCAVLLGVFGLRAVTGVAVYLIARAVLDFLTHFAEPVLSEEVNRRAAGAVRATALSWVNAISRALPLGLLPLSAIVVAHHGHAPMYLWFAAATLPLMALCLWWAGWWRKQKQLMG
jgi:MFS family permease